MLAVNSFVKLLRLFNKWMWFLIAALTFLLVFLIMFVVWAPRCSLNFWFMWKFSIRRVFLKSCSFSSDSIVFHEFTAGAKFSIHYSCWWMCNSQVLIVTSYVGKFSRKSRPISCTFCWNKRCTSCSALFRCICFLLECLHWIDWRTWMMWTSSWKKV